MACGSLTPNSSSEDLGRGMRIVVKSRCRSRSYTLTLLRGCPGRWTCSEVAPSLLQVLWTPVTSARCPRLKRCWVAPQVSMPYLSYAIPEWFLCGASDLKSVANLGSSSAGRADPPPFLPCIRPWFQQEIPGMCVLKRSLPEAPWLTLKLRMSC